MHEVNDELNHLHGSEVLFPTQVRPHTRAHRCQQIIAVHHDVDERIDGAIKADVAS